MSLIRNGAIEQQLREHFAALGYHGRATKFHSLDLTAIERPGWVQVFAFDVSVLHPENGWSRLAGSCRDDERTSSFSVRTAPHGSTIDDQDSASETAIRRDRAQPQGRDRFAPLLYFAAAAVIMFLGLSVRDLM